MPPVPWLHRWTISALGYRSLHRRVGEPQLTTTRFPVAVLSNGLATGYGYGWEVGDYAGHTIIAHNGGINGFSTQIMRLPNDKVYVAILSNDENQQSLGDLNSSQDENYSFLGDMII